MRLVCGIVVAGCLAAPAVANQVDVMFLGTREGRNVTVKYPGTSNPTGVFAGQLRHTFSNGTGLGALLSGEYLTYCTDLNNRVVNQVTRYNVTDDISILPIPGNPMGVARAALLESLYSIAGPQPMNITNNDDYAAAFQLAIWEIANDFDPSAANFGMASLSLANGNGSFFVTGGLTSAIQSHFNTLMTNVTGVTASLSNLLGVYNNTAQDQLVIISLIPTPGAGVMALVGLGGVVGVSRRRR